jgi:hypothetical protein
MCAEILYSLSLKLGLRVTEEVLRLPISRVQRWARKKIIAQIERSLNIGKTEFILLENIDQYSQTEIIVHIWSSYPLKLNTQKVIGNFGLGEFETKLDWDIKEKDFDKHKITDIEPNHNGWIFVLKIPTETLRKHVSSYWHLDFVAHFQKDFCKTFKDIKLKFRQSDVNRLGENN